MTDVLAQAVLAEHVAYSALLACELWRRVGAGSGCFRRTDPGHGGRWGTAGSCGGCGTPLGLWWEAQICSSWRAGISCLLACISKFKCVKRNIPVCG